MVGEGASPSCITCFPSSPPRTEVQHAKPSLSREVWRFSISREKILPDLDKRRAGRPEEGTPVPRPTLVPRLSPARTASGINARPQARSLSQNIDKRLWKLPTSRLGPPQGIKSLREADTFLPFIFDLFLCAVKTRLHVDITTA